MAKVRLPEVGFGQAILLRSASGDDRHAGSCAPCAYFDTYRRMFGMDARVAAVCAKHIREDHEGPG